MPTCAATIRTRADAGRRGHGARADRSLGRRPHARRRCARVTSASRAPARCEAAVALARHERVRRRVERCCRAPRRHRPKRVGLNGAMSMPGCGLRRSPRVLAHHRTRGDAEVAVAESEERVVVARRGPERREAIGQARPVARPLRHLLELYAGKHPLRLFLEQLGAPPVRRRVEAREFRRARETQPHVHRRRTRTSRRVGHRECAASTPGVLDRDVIAALGLDGDSRAELAR